MYGKIAAFGVTFAFVVMFIMVLSYALDEGEDVRLPPMDEGGIYARRAGEPVPEKYHDVPTITNISKISCDSCEWVEYATEDFAAKELARRHVEKEHPGEAVTFDAWV